jgi:2-iminobutanoate/2-iminopropanoate deaminase
MGKMILLLSSIIYLGITFPGCQPSDEQIRKIVKEELASALERTAITDANVIGPYSPAQKVGNFLFVSGQIAIDPITGELNQDNIEIETRQVLTNLMNILKKAGCDSSNVISATVYITDMKNYPKMNNVYGGYFAEGNYPARATVQVAALPRNANVEISAIAYKSK